MDWSSGPPIHFKTRKKGSEVNQAASGSVTAQSLEVSQIRLGATVGKQSKCQLVSWTHCPWRSYLVREAILYRVLQSNRATCGPLVLWTLQALSKS